MDNKSLSQKDKKRLEKQRKSVAKQAQKFHREQEKKAKKSSVGKPKSKIAAAVNSRPKMRDESLSREERFIKESDEKIRNLEPQDFDDGYYIDEFAARRKQERRAKEIHDQENEIIRKRKKPLTRTQIKRRRIALYSSIVAVVVIVGVVLSLTVLFKTEKIEIEGNTFYNDDQIIAFSGVEKQENIFVAAMTGTPEKITQSLVYIEEASLGVSVPDTVIIKLTPAVPSYVIKNGSGYLLISAKGRILEEISENKDKLPELKCSKLKSTKIGDYVSFEDDSVPEILAEISNCLQTNKIKEITGFDVTDTSNITLDYDHRISINIGLPEDIDYKIRTAMAIINEKLDPNNTGTITGTLDVSACNTTKISHYKPAETTVPPTTVQPTTAPADTSGDGYSDNQYTWSGDDAYNGDDTGYGDGTGYGDDGGYGDGTGYGDGAGYEDDALY